MIIMDLNTDRTDIMDKEYKVCLRCGRKLKTEQTRLIGMGKVCLEKSKAEKHKRLFEV